MREWSRLVRIEKHQAPDGIACLTFVDESASGPATTTRPLVFVVHGLLSRKERHSELCLALAHAGFTACALDARSHGERTTPEGAARLSGALGLEFLWAFADAVVGTAADLPLVADYLGHDGYGVIGHSMGGYVALEVMRQAPGRVRRLALLDTRPGRDSPEQSARRQAFIARAEAGGFLEVVAGLRALAFHDHALSDPSLTKAFDDMAQRVGRDAFVRQQRAIMTRVDSGTTLARISCPTLVLCGRQDLITPLENSELMAAAIPRSTLTVLEECGHMAPMERPVAVTAALGEWMGRGHGHDR